MERLNILFISLILSLLYGCIAPPSRLAANITETLPGSTAQSVSFASNPSPTMDLTPSSSITPSRTTTLTRTPYPTIYISPSKTPTPTRTLSPNAPHPQADGSIPICKNAEAPTPIEDISTIDGVIFYTNYFRNRLFALTGSPPQTTEIALPDAHIDSHAFSPDGQWLLAYSEKPGGTPCYGCAPLPVWLISANGRILQRKIDLTPIIAYIHQNAPTFSLQLWQFEWVNPRIIQVIVGNGETSAYDYARGYYDISQGAWWNQPLQDLPRRESLVQNDMTTDYFYDWSEISPDLSRILYTDNQGHIVLWDIDHRKELWRDPSKSGSFCQYICPAYAVWSPDSQKAALWTINNSNLRFLSRNGDDYYEIVKPSWSVIDRDFHINSIPSWSPDSRMLTIGGTISDGPDPLDTLDAPVFYIYDAQERAFTFRCPTGVARETDSYGSVLFWSPDGNFLVTQRFFADNHSPFSLFDLNNRFVYQYNHKLYSAVGWVENFAVNWK